MGDGSLSCSSLPPCVRMALLTSTVTRKDDAKREYEQTALSMCGLFESRCSCLKPLLVNKLGVNDIAGDYKAQSLSRFSAPPYTSLCVFARPCASLCVLVRCISACPSAPFRVFSRPCVSARGCASAPVFACPYTSLCVRVRPCAPSRVVVCLFIGSHPLHARLCVLLRLDSGCY